MQPNTTNLFHEPLLASGIELFHFEDSRLQQFRQLVISCLERGIDFDTFYSHFIRPEGKRVFWNPFWRHGEGYSPAELYMLLRCKGFGSVPEAAINVFWQLQEQQLWGLPEDS